MTRQYGFGGLSRAESADFRNFFLLQTLVLSANNPRVSLFLGWGQFLWVEFELNCAAVLHGTFFFFFFLVILTIESTLEKRSIVSWPTLV